MPADYARLEAHISLFVAVCPIFFTVPMSIVGACLGLSSVSTLSEDMACGRVSGQSIPNASDQTVRACLADAGAGRPRSLMDSM